MYCHTGLANRSAGTHTSVLESTANIGGWEVKFLERTAMANCLGYKRHGFYQPLQISFDCHV